MQLVPAHTHTHGRNYSAYILKLINDDDEHEVKGMETKNMQIDAMDTKIGREYSTDASTKT